MTESKYPIEKETVGKSERKKYVRAMYTDSHPAVSCSE
jgi:hypothetical protein